MAARQRVGGQGRRRPAGLGLAQWALVGLASGWGVGPTARAAGPVVPLRIDCPLLDGESRAALEARARAEMALTPLPAGGPPSDAR